jgi:hypothetical protein
LVCCASPMEANTSSAAKNGAAKAKRKSLVRILNNKMGSERRSRVAPVLSSMLT